MYVSLTQRLSMRCEISLSVWVCGRNLRIAEEQELTEISNGVFITSGKLAITIFSFSLC